LAYYSIDNPLLGAAHFVDIKIKSGKIFNSNDNPLRGVEIQLE
jgi:hypothetical protein